MSARKHIEFMYESFKALGHENVLYRCLLERGEEFTEFVPGPIPRATPNECFTNAAKLAPFEYDYVEGFVVGDGIPFPIHHAWNIDGEGRVYDNTLENPEEFSYFGIVIGDPWPWLKDFYGVLEFTDYLRDYEEEAA